MIEVSFDVEDVTVATVLDLATEPYELRWTVRDGVVLIGLASEDLATWRWGTVSGAPPRPR